MLNVDEVKKAAKLARIELDATEIPRVLEKLQTVLDFFEVLGQADTANVVPYFHGVREMNLRDDVAEASLPNEAVIRNAPESLDGAFKLPRIVGGVE